MTPSSSSRYTRTLVCGSRVRANPKSAFTMTESFRTRGPQFWGFCLGTGWVVLLIVVFGFMVSGYLEIFGIMGALFAVALVPLSAPVYPFVSWHYVGTFPWLWVLGLVIALVLSRIILAE